MGLDKDRVVKLTPDVALGAAVPHSLEARARSLTLSKLSAVVLLSGSLRTTDLARSIGRSILDLPINSTTTILRQWRDQAAVLAASVGAGPIELRVMVDHHAVLPTTPAGDSNLRVSIQRDPQDYRGTAGVLRDISTHDSDDSYLLVTNGNQVLLEPLDELAHELALGGGDITLLVGEDGTYHDMMLLRVGTLRGVREVGFMDFKEQVLPQLAKEFDVRVVASPRAVGMPVRTLDNYIAALTAHRKHLASGSGDAADSEQWFSTFAIQEDGANVAASARIHDSVILDGARVGTNAVVVRSVISGTGVVRSGQLAADRVVDRSTDLSARGQE